MDGKEWEELGEIWGCRRNEELWETCNIVNKNRIIGTELWEH